MPFFSFPDDARWNEEAEAVEFTVSLGEYTGTARVPRAVFRGLLGRRLSPEACIECYHLHKTAIERAVEEKLRRRELMPDGNVEILSRDVRPSRG
jgi:hypothetical protein